MAFRIEVSSSAKYPVSRILRSPVEQAPAGATAKIATAKAAATTVATTMFIKLVAFKTKMVSSAPVLVSGVSIPLLKMKQRRSSTVSQLAHRLPHLFHAFFTAMFHWSAQMNTTITARYSSTRARELYSLPRIGSISAALLA